MLDLWCFRTGTPVAPTLSTDEEDPVGCGVGVDDDDGLPRAGEGTSEGGGSPAEGRAGSSPVRSVEDLEGHFEADGIRGRGVVGVLQFYKGDGHRKIERGAEPVTHVQFKNRLK